MWAGIVSFWLQRPMILKTQRGSSSEKLTSAWDRQARTDEAELGLKSLPWLYSGSTLDLPWVCLASSLGLIWICLACILFFLCTSGVSCTNLSKSSICNVEHVLVPSPGRTPRSSPTPTPV